jgi:tetratricopeptide (TPR) repeat protein
MSTRVSPPPLSVDNQVELRALVNMLRVAGGFALAFARVNHPSLARRLIEEIRCALPEKEIVELRIAPASEAGLVEQWRRALGERKPDALLVLGLEALFDLAEDRSPAVDMFNFNRDYVRRHFPFPVVFFAPEFAIREFAWRAPDFWSGRSGVFRFLGDEEQARETLETLGRDFGWSLSPKERLERRAILEDLLRELEGSQAADPAAVAKAHYLLGKAAEHESKWTEAQRYFEQALSLYRELGDRLGEANTIRNLGDVALAQGRYEEAAGRYEEALALYCQIGAWLGEAHAIDSLGEVARAQERYEEAAGRYEEALALYRQIGDRLGEANAIKGLGDVARLEDRYEEAAGRYEHALALYRQLGFRLGEANAIKGLGDVARLEDRYEEAAGRYEEALALYRQIGARLGEADAIKGLGDVALAQDRYEEAAARYEQALPLYRQIGDRLDEAHTLLAQGRLARAMGELDRARAAYREAERIYRAIGRDRDAELAAAEAKELPA